MATYTEQHLSNDDVLVAQFDRVVEMQSWVFLRRGKIWAIFDKSFHDSHFTGVYRPTGAAVSVYRVRWVLCCVGLVWPQLNYSEELGTEMTRKSEISVLVLTQCNTMQYSTPAFDIKRKITFRQMDWIYFEVLYLFKCVWKALSFVSISSQIWP